jgi:hypothetical protein
MEGLFGALQAMENGHENCNMGYHSFQNLLSSHFFSKPFRLNYKKF